MTQKELTLFFVWCWICCAHKRAVASACKKRYHERHRQLVLERSRAWAKNNRERRNKVLRVWAANKQATDEQWRLGKNLRTRLWFALKAEKSASKNLEKKLGCTVAEFKRHIASQFHRGWSWANWGKVWEIDHKIPCAAFDLTRPEEVEKCFHFSNQRPLGIFENRSKGAKFA